MKYAREPDNPTKGKTSLLLFSTFVENLQVMLCASFMISSSIVFSCPNWWKYTLLLLTVQVGLPTCIMT